VEENVSNKILAKHCLRLATEMFMIALLIPASWAATETKLFNFGGTTGKTPNGGLVFDAAGNLYGTTQAGGLNNVGVVFQLKKTSKGVWVENILYTFTGLADGGVPMAGMIFDGAGNLYGTTLAGGTGLGTVFELSPNGLGGWTESVLYSFAGGSDGASPVGKLVFDGSGNLYGTTEYGGASNDGTVFELSPTASGWTETVLYAFSGSDGANPMAELILDASGNLYGTTYNGGTDNEGTVFELIRPGSSWTESLLHVFKGCAEECPDGQHPNGGLVFYGTSLVGTTTSGYGDFQGEVFELINHVTSYTEKEYGFYRGNYGVTPVGTLTYDSSSGVFYGATSRGTFQGGNSAGTIFSFTYGSGLSDVYNFTGGIIEGQTHDGEIPEGGLALDSAGNLYGSTQKGGTGADGLVFEITP
jgi:uncharacterized repeat protein (TIGR03803 family)